MKALWLWFGELDCLSFGEISWLPEEDGCPSIAEGICSSIERVDYLWQEGCFPSAKWFSVEEAIWFAFGKFKGTWMTGRSWFLFEGAIWFVVEEESCSLMTGRSWFLFEGAIWFLVEEERCPSMTGRNWFSVEGAMWFVEYENCSSMTRDKWFSVKGLNCLWFEEEGCSWIKRVNASSVSKWVSPELWSYRKYSTNWKKFYIWIMKQN